jgi:FixJ family two-component response regulator
LSFDPARTVFIVDDDEAVRRSIGMLLRTVGLGVETFGSAFEFLERFRSGQAGCVLLDIQMPGMNGLAVQDELNKRRICVPIVFLTGHGDVPMAVRALQKGAHDFLEKPFEDQRLVYAVLNALRNYKQRASLEAVPVKEASAEPLSAREEEVLRGVLDGKRSRTIAEELHISEKTVEYHRARIRAKLGVQSLAELFKACLPAMASRSGSSTEETR